MRDNRSYLRLVRSHFDKQLRGGKADFGPTPTPMWLASLDTRTGMYPEDDTRPAHIPRRHYRAIDAPKGCSLYWDQPAIVAACALSAHTGDVQYAQAVERYIREFLAHCVADNGIFLWGNHYYWDAFRGCTVRFGGEEDAVPVDFAREDGAYHEARPIPPAWDAFWQVDAVATERQIRTFVDRSLHNKETGCFNRHADGHEGCAFLEAGGILVESLAWLFAKTGDEALLAQADAVAKFSYSFRNESTGLVENNPTKDRWDKEQCTTEIGLWAGSLLRAATHAPAMNEWTQMADSAMAAYLKFGFDEEAKRYWGRLRVADGTPVREKGTRPGDHELSLKHQPEVYADPWRPLFPAHDYPMPFAESCLTLHALTEREEYYLAGCRWAEQIAASLPAREGQGGYAEHYGRCIHFLWRAGRMLGEGRFMQLAESLAEEAVETLFAHDMFRSHPGENRYDAVDGVGYLLLALIALATNEEPEFLGLGW